MKKALSTEGAFLFSLVEDDCADAATTACILRNIKKFLTFPNKIALK